MMELVGPLPGTLPLPSLPEYQLPYLQHPLPSQRGPQTSWGNLHLLVPSGSVDLVNSEASKNASSEDVGDGVWSLNPCSKDVDEVKHPCSKDVGDSKEVKKPKSDKPKAEELCEKPITRGQEKALEKFFKKTKYPTAQQKAVLTKTLKLTKIQVVNWFWNRRVKMRTEDELRLKSRTQDEIKQDELKLKTFEYQCRILAPSKQSCIVAPSAYHPYPMPHLWAPVHAPNTPFYHRQPVFHQPLQNPYYQSPGFFPLPLPHQPVMGNTGLEPYNPFQLERNMGLSGQQQF